MEEPRIPRREVLEARHRRLLKRLANLQRDYEDDRASIETDIAHVTQQMDWHSYSQERKDLIEQVRALPEAPGVYEIVVNNKTIYVGEAKNIRGRAIDHVYQTFSYRWSDDIVPKLYRVLAVENPRSICIVAHTIGIEDKHERLTLETALMKKRMDEGHPLENVSQMFGSTVPERVQRAHRGHALKKTLIESDEEWDSLLTYMSPAVREAQFIRSLS